MATLKYRLNRKNASGTYDTIHYETSSNIVMRPSGRTVEQDLADFLPRSQNDDNVPQSLTHGQISVANNYAFAKLGNGSVANMIYTHPTTKQCNYSVDTSAFATKTELENLEKKISLGSVGFSSPALGARIRIGGFDYVIVHIDTSIVYAIIEICPSLTQFSSGSTTYAGSTIANLCTAWYNNNVPTELKSAGIFVSVTVNGVTAPCFIPSYDQMNGGFSYFTSNSPRIASVYINGGSGNYNGYFYWTSTAHSSGFVWYVYTDGCLINGGYPAYSFGFRPALAIRRSAFS